MRKIVVFDEIIDDETVAALSRVDDQIKVVAPAQPELAAEMSDAEIFFGFHSPEIFANATQLKWIQTSSAGVDAILNSEIVARNIVVSNASGIHAPQVAATAWALTLALCRSIPTYLRQQQNHIWKLAEHIDLAGQVVAVIGLGGIGRRYANVAAAFGMRVIAIDNQNPPKPESVEAIWATGQLNELLSIADVVLLSCPCTAETHQLMNPERFACMKRTALLINVARGELVDETALVHALENETIQGAGIDVCQTEPLPANSPLWDVPNLVITPHSAGYSPERRNRLVEFFSKNLRRYLAGETLMNIVDPETGYPKPNDFC